MNILAHGPIFLLLVLCYFSSCLTATAPRINFTTMEVSGIPVRMKSYVSSAHCNYGIVGKHRGKSCYHICGVRQFVQASHFYDFSGFYRGYIELKNPGRPGCYKKYEFNESYSFLEGNDDFCFCVRPNIQNILYLVAGFPELHFPPINRVINESQFYEKNWDPEDVYLTRSPCEGPYCSVRVDPYLAYTMNFSGNQTLVTPKKRTMVSELDRVLRDVKAMEADLENAKMTHEQIAKDNDLNEKTLSVLKENQSALRKEIAEEQIENSRLSGLLQDLKMKNNEWMEIKLLKDEIQRLKAVDEENAGFQQKNKDQESNLQSTQQQLTILKESQEKRNLEKEQMEITMHALQNENEKLKVELNAKKQAVEELQRTQVDYNVVQEQFQALEREQKNLKSELNVTLNKVMGLEVEKAKLEMTVNSTRPVFDQLKNAKSQTMKLQQKLGNLLAEKRKLEVEKRQYENATLETQKERDEARTKLNFCSQKVEDLQKESEASVGELESLQRNQTEALRKKYESSVLNMENEIRSLNDEIRNTQALASELKEKKENTEDMLIKVQTELVQLRNENSELKIHSKEKLKLLEEKAQLQNVLKKTQENVTSLENANTLFKKEKALRQAELGDLSENYKALKSENKNQSQELKEFGKTRLILQQLQSKFNELEVERDLLKETVKLFKTQTSSLANENSNLTTEIQAKNEKLKKLDRAILEIKTLQTELMAIKAEKHKTKEDLTGAQKKLTELEVENDVLKKDVQLKEEMTRRLLTLEQETARANATLNELIIKKRQTEDALLAAQEKVQALSAENSNMQNSLKEKIGLQKKLNFKKKIIDEVQDKLAKLETEKSLTQTKLSSLEKELERKSLAIVEFEKKKMELDSVPNLSDKKSSAQSQSMEYREQPPCGARKNSAWNPQNEPQVYDPILHAPKTPNSCPFSDNTRAQESTTNVMSTAVSFPEVPDDDDDDDNDDDKTKKGDSPNSSGSISSPYANIFVFAAVLATLA